MAEEPRKCHLPASPKRAAARTERPCLSLHPPNPERSPYPRCRSPAPSPPRDAGGSALPNFVARSCPPAAEPFQPPQRCPCPRSQRRNPAAPGASAGAALAALPAAGRARPISRPPLGTAQPGTAQPGTAQPGTAQPGTVQPGTAQPGPAPARPAGDAPLAAAAVPPRAPLDAPARGGCAAGES